MKISVTLEIEVSDIPEVDREQIKKDSGMRDKDMPRIAEMGEDEVRAEVIDAFCAMFDGTEYDTQSEMWAGSDFYGYITGLSVKEPANQSPSPRARG